MTMLELLRQDLYYALRGLRLRPGFAATVAVTIALAVGASATMFGIIDRLLFRAPDEIRDPDSVVEIETHEAGSPYSASSFSYAAYTDYRDQPGPFASVAVTSEDKDFSLGHGRDATRMSGALVSASFFTVLGVPPALALLVAESALAVSLLVTAGLFIRSLANVRALDLGFEPERVLSVGIQWPPEADPSRQAADWERVRLRVTSLPDIERAALTIGSPFGNVFGFGLRVPGRDSLPTIGGPWLNAVSPDYFAAVGTRLVRGRLFTPGEGAGTEPVTIVSETMAQTLWPNESALGYCLLIGAGKDVPCARIVGVVRDARRSALREKPPMQYYVPFGQERAPIRLVDYTEMLVRPRTATKGALAALRQVIAHDAPGVRFIDIHPMQDRIDPLIRSWRLGAELLGVFGALALIVAATRLYGGVAYVTAQRMHEFGVRIALGAHRANLLGIVMNGATRVALVGAAIGIVISLIAARWLGPLLFNESARDPLVIGVVAGLLMTVTAMASLDRPGGRRTSVRASSVVSMMARCIVDDSW